jgi:hypothetical protein
VSDVEVALAAAATLVATAFACATLERWLVRRRPHELAWTISLTMFAVASAAMWWAEASGWSAPTFRAFYLFGAILNVPWLAMGTIYLLARRRLADAICLAVAIVSGFAAGVLVTVPMRAAVPPDELPEGRALFDPLPRVLAAVGSGLGALVVIGGAGWSAWRLLRGRGNRRTVSARRLAIGNLVIATGTLVLSASGTLAGRLGKDRAFAVTLLIGIVILFCGFLVATPSRAAAAIPLRSAKDAA